MPSGQSVVSNHPPILPDLSLRALARLPIQSLPPAKRLAEAGTVVTFGVFDGVHRGHCEMLRRVKERAAQLGATPVAVVMRPRPVETLGLSPARPYLTSLEATIGLIREAGIDVVSVLRFNRNLALSHPHDFLRKLQARTKMRELWLGSRARIGRGPEGSIASAKALGAEAGFEVVSCEEVEIWDDFGQSQQGSNRLSKLNHVLGRNYELPGYAGPPLQMLGDEFAEFPLAVPKLLYLPPRGNTPCAFVRANSTARIPMGRRPASGPSSCMPRTGHDRWRHSSARTARTGATPS
jgi:hypothetical protein